jgi:ATP-dependent helicase HrpB
MDRLRLVPISRASADQRAGRAGRTQPGVCIRLWDEPSHRGRPEQTLPEIKRVDLCGAVLQLAALGEPDVRKFPWLDAPNEEAAQQSLRLLEQLTLLDGGALTKLGEEAAPLPVHPRLGRLLLEGARLGCSERAALAAALLSERDPFLREFDSGPPVRAAPPTVSDVLDRVEALEAFEANGRLDGPLGRLHRGGANAVLEVHDQLIRLLASGGLTPPEAVQRDEALLRCVFAAYPDRLARRREPSGTKALTVGGRGVKLAPTSGYPE